MSYNYWDSRYRDGGTSGAGSIGGYREWKWNTISRYVNDINNVIDVGCGDLSFWSEKDCLSYIGIDLSPFIIDENQKKRPGWNFICASADKKQPIKAPIVFCFDVLFHIIDENAYLSILNNLMDYSSEWIFIYTWQNNPFNDLKNKTIILGEMKNLHLVKAIRWLLKGTDTDDLYQKYRDFSRYHSLFLNNGFKLISVEKYKNDKYGAMYIFKK